MPSLGVLFDITALGGGLYGKAAYRLLFSVVGARELTGCELSDGDVEQETYCIAIDTDDARQLAVLRHILSSAVNPGFASPNRRLLFDQQVTQLPLVRATYVTSAGELSRCETAWIKQAWDEVRSPIAAPPASAPPAGANSEANPAQERSPSDVTSSGEGSGSAATELNGAPAAIIPDRPTGAREYVPGQVLGGKYYIREVLRGGMGLVYIVDELSSLRSGGSLVLALKTFQDRFLWNEDAIQRFEREAMRWTDLELHPHIVTALLVERVEGRPYIWLEYVDGGSLADRLAQGALDPADAVRLAIQFARGMRHAHENHGLLHRDIKPANCLLTREGVLKISDFGLSKLRAELLAQVGDTGASPGVPPLPGSTQPGVRAGTPAYMPPEVILDPASMDARGDIYSFGVMFHEMLTGKPLFSGAGVMQQHLSARPPVPSGINPALPPTLDALVLKCLEKEPGRRFASFAEVESALEPIACDLLGAVPPLSESRAIERHGRRFMRAFTLMEFGRLDDAVAIWHELAAATPDQAEIHNNLALCLARLGRLDEACRQVRRAVELKPDYAQAWANLGGFLGRLGRFDEAIAACDRAIAVKPDWAEAHANRGANLAALGRNAEARRCFEQALKADPKYWQAHVMAAEALAREGRPPQQILECVQQALAIHPRDPAALAIAAACLDDLGRESDADRYLDLAERVDARHPLVRDVAEVIRRKRARS